MYLPILIYHRILPGSPDRATDPHRIAVSQDQFRSHLKCLKSLGYRTASLADYAAQLIGGQASAKKTFAITFDDGYEDVLTLALPVLQEFGFTASVFAVPGQLGGVNAWDDGHAKLLSAAQYRTLAAAGITIGAHTSSHVHLPQVDPAVARREIADSKKRLEDMLGHAVMTFAYPYGESTPLVESFVQEAGFEAAYATDRAPRDQTENLFRIRRVVVFPRTNIWGIWWKVQPWYPVYQDWKRR
jgi:peptidoglycan/xylan/chitin deacetylase (PgdA/CDA1 family)